MTCLDTTFLVDLLRGSQPAKQKYEELRLDDDHSCTTIVNAYELAKGAMLTKDPGKNLKVVHELLSELVVLELDLNSVDLSSELYSRLIAKGKLMGEFDILIASICISNGQKLLSNDNNYDAITQLTRLGY